MEEKKKSKSCNCESCQRSRRIDKAISEKNIEQLTKIVNELNERLLNVESDNCYYEAILDGKWPSAKATLIAAICKVDIPDNMKQKLKHLLRTCNTCGWVTDRIECAYETNCKCWTSKRRANERRLQLKLEHKDW